jgi:hypothetical protein
MLRILDKLATKYHWFYWEYLDAIEQFLNGSMMDAAFHHRDAAFIMLSLLMVSFNVIKTLISLFPLWYYDWRNLHGYEVVSGWIEGEVLGEKPVPVKVAIPDWQKDGF